MKKLLIALIAATAVVTTAVIVLSGDDSILRSSSITTAADYEYEIPLGTGKRTDAGEELDIFPRLLKVRVGESIRIVNNDDRDHLIGTFFVGAGETLTQEFVIPGMLTGECSIRPGSSFTIQVFE
ncbi:MAG: cupredoxin domain-containing protein [Ilumatobacteraceae bacterium]